MTFSHRLAHLRFDLDRLYRQDRLSRPRTCPPLHLLLPVPISERLVLLAQIDGATPQEMKALLKVKDDDLSLKSERMIRALTLLDQAQRDPFLHWSSAWFEAPLISSADITQVVQGTGYVWDERHGHEVERACRQVLFSSSAACLIGECVPVALRHLTLRERLLIYCLLVEEMQWSEIQALLHCSEWSIRESINKTFTYLGGT